MNTRYEGIFLKPTKEQEFYIVSQSQGSAYGHGLTWIVDQWASFSSGGDTLEDEYNRLCEGGYVVDKRHLSWEVACKAISGPMDSCQLKPMSFRHWDTIVTFSSMYEFQEYIKEHGPKRLWATTFMSLDLYAEWWRIQGAKVGRKIEGQVRWYPMWTGEI